MTFNVQKRESEKYVVVVNSKLFLDYVYMIRIFYITVVLQLHYNSIVSFHSFYVVPIQIISLSLIKPVVVEVRVVGLVGVQVAVVL